MESLVNGANVAWVFGLLLVVGLFVPFLWREHKAGYYRNSFFLGLGVVLLSLGGAGMNALEFAWRLSPDTVDPSHPFIIVVTLVGLTGAFLHVRTATFRTWGERFWLVSVCMALGSWAVGAAIILIFRDM